MRMMKYRDGLLKLLDERPRSRGSKRSLKELERLGKYASEVWKGMEALRWVEWKGKKLIVRRF